MSAARHEPEVRPLASMVEIVQAVDVLSQIWGEPGPLSAEMLRALGHAGGYASGAWVDDELVGVSAGFLARRDGVLLLHSHISGVATRWQGRGIGLALKKHQQGWAKAQGLSAIEWTFDPLGRRNAHFNLGTLGATIIGFEPGFYGTMRDALNAGDESDRAIVRWPVGPTLSGRVNVGNTNVILSSDEHGDPVVDVSSASVVRAWIPDDHAAMRAAEPERARRWRLALRESFGVAVRDGYVAVDMTRDGWYTLVRRTP